MVPARPMRQPFLSQCPVCQADAATPVVTFDQLSFGRCVDCGLIYKREQTRELPREYEEEYFRFNRGRYLERWEHRVQKCSRQIFACLEFAPAASSLLDIGCSAGYVLEAARRVGLEPTGLDSSNFAVSLCRERGYAAELGSLTQMPLPSEAFDIVTLKHTLEHVADPMAGLREVQRVLRPGGVALIVVPDAAYYKITVMPRRGRSFRPDRRGWQHHVYFYETNLLQACRQSELSPVKLGKDIYRRRLARGPRRAYEWLRWIFMLGWTHFPRITRLRREIQLIARKPDRSTSEVRASVG
jgi:SAM-dependent methyltransferase